MKKSLLSFIVVTMLLSASAAFAGLRQGAKELGLNITGGYTQNEGNSKSGDVGAQVSVGYFITEKIQVGCSVMDIYSGTKSPAGDATNFNMLNIAAQAKFYMPWERASAPFHSYIGPHAGFTSIYSDAGADGTTITGLALGAMVGFDLFVNEDVALNGEARYTHSELSGDFDSKSDDIRGLLGFKVFFGGK